MNFKDALKEKIKYAEDAIEEFLPPEEGFQRDLMRAMNYSVRGGGKRLRPILMKECFDLFGGTSSSIRPFMAAMEMIHTYSLVHDDLPAMDDDEYRRGRKTTHVVFGEALGILAGDGLLNYAFEVAMMAYDADPANPANLPALRLLANNAGINGMIGGQTVDVQSEGKPLNRQTLDYIYRMKTGALIEASMKIGAMLAGASEEELEKIGQAGRDIGLAFQIQDDILDVTSTIEVLGKPIHSDEKNNKTTYVTLEGLSKASEDVEKISNRALQTLAGFPKRNEFLEELVRSLIHREK